MRARREELREQGGLAILYALGCILIYVALRFEKRFSVGAVAALVHDVLITIGVFALFQLDFDLSVLAICGTDFQQRVRQLCAEIPLGETRRYAELAQSAGSPRAARAVGGVMAGNPYPIVVPCHRVLSTNGLGGYAGGLDAKRWLLAHEADMRR